MPYACTNDIPGRGVAASPRRAHDGGWDRRIPGDAGSRCGAAADRRPCTLTEAVVALVHEVLQLGVDGLPRAGAPPFPSAVLPGARRRVHAPVARHDVPVEEGKRCTFVRVEEGIGH